VSVKLSPAAAERLKLDQPGAAALPPLPEIMLLGEVSVDEAAILFVQKVADVVSQGKANSLNGTGSERRRAVEAALWLEANLAGQVRLEDVARQAGSSPFHFLRAFRKAIGVTPHQYLLRLRLREAARLLAEGSMPVTQVALEVGFQDLSNFVRTFKRAAGVPPARFSKRLPKTRSSLKLLGELHV
jgi:transcriptional regulator GlxA family with amidase domain